MRTITHRDLSFLKVIYLLLFGVILKSNCGKAPSEPPPQQVGSINITARLDTLRVDSMLVRLDNDSLGVKPNPCLLTDIVAGRHQVAISKDDPESAVDFSSCPRLVSVKENDTTDVTFTLTKFAPIFTLKTLTNDKPVSLADYRGKVVLLVFFSLG